MGKAARSYVHTLMTCRFCGEITHDPERMVKYGRRHYAHHACYLKAGKPLSDLHDWQIVNFPYRLIKEHGQTEAAEAAYRRKNTKTMECR